MLNDSQFQIIDIHCHVLPCVDDGAQSMVASFKMLKSASEQGVSAVIATPHYSRRSEDPDRKERQLRLCKKLESEAREKIDPAFRVYLGQELLYHESLISRLKDGYGWTLADSSYVLIEFDFAAEYETIYRGLRNLINAGYVPILAHMERFPSIRTEQRIAELKSLGVCMQMNYESLEGSSLWSSETRWCRKQVKAGTIDVLGTDMHDPDHRPPRIKDAMDWMQRSLPEAEIQRMCCSNPMRILRDEALIRA